MRFEGACTESPEPDDAGARVQYGARRDARAAMSKPPVCPVCGSEATYPDGAQMMCAECAHEWVDGEAQGDAADVVRDSNGNLLVAGDSVVVIKDLKVKGSTAGLKQGTLIRSIRLVDGDAHHIEGHSDAIRGLVLKTCFLRKA